MVILWVKELQPQEESGCPAFHGCWQTGEAALQVLLLPFLLTPLPKLTCTDGCCPTFLSAWGMWLLMLCIGQQRAAFLISSCWFHGPSPASVPAPCSATESPGWPETVFDSAGITYGSLQGDSTALYLGCSPCFWGLRVEGRRRQLELWLDRKRADLGALVVFCWDETVQPSQIRTIATILTCSFIKFVFF